MEKRKIILITWFDSKGVTSQWEYWDGLKALKPSKCFSVGFLVDETKEYKTIAQSVSDTQVLGRITIPCRSIQEIEVMEIGQD